MLKTRKLSGKAENQAPDRVGIRSMKIQAAVARTGAIVDIETCELSEPGPGEAQVRLEACGVCHTDQLALEGQLGAPMPAVLGHVVVGIVEALADLSRVNAIKPVLVMPHIGVHMETLKDKQAGLTDEENCLVQDFRRLQKGEPDDVRLLDYFDSLPAMPASRMLGDWAGGILSHQHPVEKQLEAIEWHGKRFIDANNVNPIMSLDASGNRMVNDVLGGASLREVVFRGVATATMIYDKSPVFDHFRKVTDDLVVGIMDQKGNDRPLVFFLSRLAA